MDVRDGIPLMRRLSRDAIERGVAQWCQEEDSPGGFQTPQQAALRRVAEAGIPQAYHSPPGVDRHWFSAATARPESFTTNGLRVGTITVDGSLIMRPEPPHGFTARVATLAYPNERRIVRASPRPAVSG